MTLGNSFIHMHCPTILTKPEPCRSEVVRTFSPRRLVHSNLDACPRSGVMTRIIGRMIVWNLFLPHPREKAANGRYTKYLTLDKQVDWPTFQSAQVKYPRDLLNSSCCFNTVTNGERGRPAIGTILVFVALPPLSTVDLIIQKVSFWTL
jgi:hypothetical protein